MVIKTSSANTEGSGRVEEKLDLTGGFGTDERRYDVAEQIGRAHV